MRFLVLAIAALFAFTSVAHAGSISAPAGGAKDWIWLSADSDAIELVTPLTGVAYNVVMDEEGYYGFTVALRASQGAGDGSMITEWSLGYWRVMSAMEWFIDGKFENWGKELTGEQEFLGGARSGIRFDVGGLPFEFSGHYAGGADGIKHSGAYFGLYIERETKEG